VDPGVAGPDEADVVEAHAGPPQQFGRRQLVGRAAAGEGISGFDHQHQLAGTRDPAQVRQPAAGQQPGHRHRQVGG
jgi:hypothetical protein